MRTLIIALALSVVALTGCSSDAAEKPQANDQDKAETAWRADVEEALGTDTFDFEAIQQNAAADCQRTTTDGWTISLGLSGSTSTATVTRIGLEHACSEVLPVFDEAVAAVDAAEDTSALVCSLPTDGVSLDDQAKLELVCSQG